MTESTRAKASRRPRRSASQLFIAALVVFGVAASVLLLFSENIQWLRVGLVSALWAAIVGAFAMTKYRRESVADQTKAKDLQTVYELQLAREISARREYELGVEARVRSEVQLDTSEVAALRAELAHLRNNLQMLFDGNLPTERVALRADAVRMQELGGSRNYDSYQPAPSGLYIPGGGPQPGQSNPPEGESRPLGNPGIATPYDEPVTAETSVLYPDSPIGSEPPAGYSSTPPREATSAQREPRVPGNGRRTPTPPRATPSYSAPDVDSHSSGGGSAGDNGYEAAAPEPEPDFAVAEPVVAEPVVAEPIVAEPAVAEPAVEESPAADAQADASGAGTTPESGTPEPRSRRRRRSEPESEAASGAHSNGRSVAEIMAGLQSGDGGTQQRRHRRRAE